MLTRLRSSITDTRGAVIALVAVLLVVLLGAGGLALDSARGYLIRAHLARAVDAGVLAGARSLRQGQGVARQRATELALANGAASGGLPSQLTVTFGLNEFGEQTVRMDGVRQTPTLLMRVLGIDSMTVRATAVAAVPPVDLVMALDQSGSMIDMGAWDDLQDAANEFVANFDDDIDQMGLTSFQLRGTERFSLAGDFKSPIGKEIKKMKSAGDTNPGEGLRLAWEQLRGPAVRERSAKVVVFFTDGRPTAFRGKIGGQDRMMAVYRTQEGVVRGYFDKPDKLPKDKSADPSGCQNKKNCFAYWTENRVRDEARDSGLEMADAIRSDGFLIYSIGLGNPKASDPLEVPDLDYLKQIANEGGVSDPNQPRGKSYFAPSAAELESVFNLVANDLLVRLAQ